MTIIKHLQLIKEKCEDIIEISTKSPESFMPTQIAACKSTIASVVECLLLIEEGYEMESDPVIIATFAAWPIELLKP